MVRRIFPTGFMEFSNLDYIFWSFYWNVRHPGWPGWETWIIELRNQPLALSKPNITKVILWNHRTSDFDFWELVWVGGCMNGWILTDGRCVSSSRTARARCLGLPWKGRKTCGPPRTWLIPSSRNSPLYVRCHSVVTPKHADEFGMWRRPLFELFKMNMDPISQCIAQAQIIIVFLMAYSCLWFAFVSWAFKALPQLLE